MLALTKATTKIRVSDRFLLALALLCPACHPSSSHKPTPQQPLQTDVAPQNGNQGDNQVRVISGGVIDGNGGELITNEHNPWFVGPTGSPPVNYCVSVSPNFSLNSSDAKRQIAEVFSIWKNVLTKLNVMNSYADYSALKGKGSLAMILDFKEVSCDSKPPLVFKLGVNDDSVLSSLQYSAEDTVGFALRTSYADATASTQGFIWTAPDKGADAYKGPTLGANFWSTPHIFHNVIMHEIGHILGIQHIPNTIMDARAPAKIVQYGLDIDWNGEDIINNDIFSSPFCGELPPDTDPTALNALTTAGSSDTQMCLTPRNDLKGSDENTPTLIEFKKSNSVVASQRVTNSGVWTDVATISGSYLEKDQTTDPYAYKTTTFLDLTSRGLIRGSFVKADGSTQPLEIEMPSPGFALIRIPVQGQWRTIAAYADPYQDSLTKLTSLLGKD